MQALAGPFRIFLAFVMWALPVTVYHPGEVALLKVKDAAHAHLLTHINHDFVCNVVCYHQVYCETYILSADQTIVTFLTQQPVGRSAVAAKCLSQLFLGPPFCL